MGDEATAATTRIDGGKGGSLPPGVELPRGATLGRYTIIRRLGAGGMGVVYLAFDPELDRRVAVKLLRARRSGVGGSDGEARLLREAQVMAKLSHANVIPVFDVGTFEGDVFIAMEYVKGSTLREWWMERARLPNETLGILVQAGRGLAAAHHQGILHRDFKPENVLVDDQGRARVLDFGLARASGASSVSEPPSRFELDDTQVGSRSAIPLTQSGVVLGTPEYMAPEQLVGAPVDARSDQYAFCITAYEALYGVRPFDGDTVVKLVSEMDAGHVRAPPPGHAAPREALAVLSRGLARKPEDRWRTMGALLDAMEATTRTPRRRTGTLAVGLGAVAAIVVAVLALGRPKTPVCTGAEQSLAGVWDPAARSAVAGSFRASGKPDAEAMLGRVTKALDEYTAGWVSMSTEACVATRVRGVQSDEALDLRAGCLRSRLEDVRAFAALLRVADRELVDNAYGAVLRLRPIAACADVQALRAAYQPIGDERARLAVDSLRHDVANVVARFNAGRCEEATPLASSLDKHARDVSYAPARADAFYWSARVAHSCGDPKVAAELFLQALADAQVSHQDEVVARVLTMLVDVEGSALSRYDEGRDLARLAEASIRRIGGPEAMLGDLARARGWVEYTHGNLDAALPLRREALALHIRASGDGDPDALQMHAELADLEYEAGSLRDALSAEKDLVQRSVDLLGAGHVRTGRFLLDVAETLIAQGKYTEAASWLDRARPIVGDAVGVHLRFVDATERIGLGGVSAGTAQLEKLAVTAEHDLGADDPEPLSLRADVAKWLVVHRQTQAGLDVARPLVQHLQQLRDPGNPWYSNAYAALALGLARSGHAAEAVAIADRGVMSAEHGAAQLPFALLARAEIALASGARSDAVPALEYALSLVAARGGIDAIILGDIDAALARAVGETDPSRAAALTAEANREYASSADPALSGSRTP